MSDAPTIRAALAAGWRAAARSAWLAPVGMVVGLARSALALPAVGLAAWLLVKGAAAGVARHGPFPGAVLEGALAVATAPRFLAIVSGLWLSALLLGAALRVAYLAGAMPTLGRELSDGGSRPPEFAAGVAFRFPRVAGTAILVFLLELAGSGFAITLSLGALLVSLRRPTAGASLAVAALAAAALTLAVFVPFALSAVGDAALARTALRDEAPARAVASALLRFVRRPAAFLLASLLVVVVGFTMTGSLRAVTNVATGLARGGSTLLLLGPELMGMALAAALGALVELWRLATLAVLACSDCGNDA